MCISRLQRNNALFPLFLFVSDAVFSRELGFSALRSRSAAIHGLRCRRATSKMRLWLCVKEGMKQDLRKSILRA